MPVYQFECPACGHHWGTLVLIQGQQPERTCPRCGRTEPTEVAVERIEQTTHALGCACCL